MKVFVERLNKHLELEAQTGNDLLEKLEISPQSVILVRNGEVILGDEKISSDDEIEILSVISGG